MRLPSKLRISGHDIKVVRFPKVPNEEYGYQDRNAGVIGVCTGVSKAQVATTALHEVLHFAMAESGLRALLIDVSGQGRDVEEEIVSRLEPILFSALRDNPKLVRYIMEA